MLFLFINELTIVKKLNYKFNKFLILEKFPTKLELKTPSIITGRNQYCTLSLFLTEYKEIKYRYTFSHESRDL